MKNKVLYTLILCALYVQATHAQTKQNPWGLGIMPSTYSFYALRDGSNFFNSADYGGGVALSLHKYASKSFDLGFVTGFARVRHPNDISAVRADQRDNFLHGQLSIKYKLNNGYILSDKSIVSPYLATGIGANSYKDFKDWGLHVPVAIGLQVQIPKTPISVAASTSFNIAVIGASYLHHSIGFVVNMGTAKKKKGSEKTTPEEDPNANPTADNKNTPDATDSDYDGIPNEIDRCPFIYGTSLTFGCPDFDGDGVADNDDRCPDDKGYANLLGCGDRDNDGVIDPDDQCPDVYGVAPTGCPAMDSTDLDGDGVTNELDECPEVKGLFTAKGCPDADGDGIKDELDECPDYFGIAQHKGCPLPKEEMEQMKKIYNNQVLAKKYNLTDPRNPYNPRNDNFDPTDPYNPYNPNNPEFNVTDPENPFNPDHPMFDINNEHNPYNQNSKNYSPKYAKIKPYDPNKNPADLNPKDPANFGRIVIGNPASDKYGGFNNNRGKNKGGNNKANNNISNKPNKGNKGNTSPSLYDNNFTYVDTNPKSLTGFEERPTLSKEEEEYCNRLNLDELKAAIYFGTGQASTNDNALGPLDKIVDAMRKCAILEIQIAGHTDADGNENTNLSLSERRAQAVLKYITGQGISDRRLKYNAYGEKYPLAPNDSPNNKQQNRRAEIKVQKTF
jgi:outer membrane protein OmpA-like peptidoglycan-associated protein